MELMELLELSEPWFQDVSGLPYSLGGMSHVSKMEACLA